MAAGRQPVNFAAFAADLRAVIDARAVSLRQAAREAGVAPIIVSRATRYAEPCSLENFARLCRWAGLSADLYIVAAPPRH